MTAVDSNYHGWIEGGDGKADAVVFPSQVWPRGEMTIYYDRRQYENRTLYRETVDELHRAANELAEHTPVRLNLTGEEPTGAFVILEVSADRLPRGSVDVKGSEGRLFFTSGPRPHVVRHEVGHLWGLFHTHQRADRDQHVTVHPDSIIPGHLHNFEKVSRLQPHIGPYDLDSVMHYGGLSFATSNRCLAITRARLGFPSDACVDRGSLSIEHDIFPNERYSHWDFNVISALYCEPEHCGENCAPRNRCETPEVSRRLAEVREWRRGVGPFGVGLAP